MNKFLLTLAATGLCASACLAADYGTTPEEAVPMGPMGWLLPTLENAPEAAYFTYTNTQTSPVLWGDAPSGDAEKQIYVYLCDGGQEAFQMSEGTNTYVLLPGQEYLVKITPKETGSFCMMSMMMPTALPPKMQGTAKYYPIVISQEELGLAQSVAKNTTTWFQFEVPYPTQIVASDVTLNMIPDLQLEAIHVECPGGTNFGDGIVGPYVKAGKNIVGVSFIDGTEEDIKVIMRYNAMITLNCSNNLLRGEGLKLDVKTTYPDAYYTVDKYFEVPEDGDYTFINHGAPGTMLNIGKVIVPDPENAPYKSECDWTDIKSATVGTENASVSVTGLKKGEIVAVQSDAFGIIGEGMQNLPYLEVIKGSGVSMTTTEGNALKAVAVNGTLTVESQLLAAGAEVAVYDMNAKKVASANAAKGSVSATMALDVTPGVYVVVVYGKGNSEATKVVVK